MSSGICINRVKGINFVIANWYIYKNHNFSFSKSSLFFICFPNLIYSLLLMLKNRLDGKVLGVMLLMLMAGCFSAFSADRTGPWTVDPAEYRYDMSLYFSVSLPEYENLEAYEIGAFIGDECRGLAEKLDLPDNRHCLSMRIRSNSTESEEVEFQVRNKVTGSVVLLKASDEEPFLFEPDGMIGLPSEPFVLTPYFNVSVTAGENGSVEFEDGLYAAGTVLSLVAVPDEGYHFVNWNDGVEEASRTVTVSEDLSLTAYFAISSYQAVFKIDEEIIATYEIVFGDPIVLPETPVREGYTFGGWNDVPETMPAHDITIYGSFTVNIYTLTVYLDSEVYMNEVLAYGSPVEIPDPVVDDDHIFDGWEEEIPSTMPAHDVVIHGTTSPKDSSVGSLAVNKDSVVSVYNLKGILLYKDIKAGEIIDLLPAGIYIVNGRKVVIE